jgi:hypothetical protein
VAGLLPGTHKVLGSIMSTLKNKKIKKGKEKINFPLNSH